MGAFKTFLLTLKIIFGVVDVATDVILARNLLSGEFRLGLYFSSERREDYDHTVGQLDTEQLGWLVLVNPWLAGLARIMFVATEKNWRGVPFKDLAIRVAKYTLATLGWPLFNNVV